MARYSNASPYSSKWTTAHLIAQIRSIANMERFGGNLPAGLATTGNLSDVVKESNAIREATRIYRDTWLNPLINELERRVVKPKK